MQRGFSLVELSIVLVILGLLTGGILAGQSLIRASELRSVASDFTRYKTAAMTFRDKYFALPGDMGNATAFWGVRAAGTNLACQTTVNVYTGTCNSTPDGIIDEDNASDVTGAERFLFWQHMAYAGLIEGSYTGASTSSTGIVPVIGINLPGNRLGGRYSMFAPGSLTQAGQTLTGSSVYFDGTRAVNVIGTSLNGNGLFTPEEQWNLDTKLDDGKPALGAVWATKASDTPCATTDLTTAEYDVASKSKTCIMYMYLGLGR